MELTQELINTEAELGRVRQILPQRRERIRKLRDLIRSMQPLKHKLSTYSERLVASEIEAEKIAMKREEEDKFKRERIG